MKWNHNGIKYRRGCYDPLIAQFDSCGPWYRNRGMMTQQSMKTCFKELGEKLGAKSVEVKHLYDDDDIPTEREGQCFMKLYDGSYRFKTETYE